MLTTSTDATLDRADVSARLRLTLALAARRLRQQNESGLTPSQSSMLAHIDRDGPVTPSELADQARISRPTVTRLISRLKEQGLVVSVPDARDKRSYRVQVTPKGRALRQHGHVRKNAYLARVLRGATDEEVALLAEAGELLDRLLNAKP